MNEIAEWMIKQGYATGHGDSVVDLLTELEWQVAEKEREMCAKVCEEQAVAKRFASSYEEGFADGADMCANAIRTRGEK